VTAVTVALDAMGGDRAPVEICAGAAAAAVPGVLEVLLFGDGPAIRAALGGTVPPGITIEHTTDVIAFDEDPSVAVRAKPDSSLVATCRAVRDGRAAAAVSAGSTGAMVTASTVTIRRQPGVIRPSLASVFPSAGGPLTVLDCGANADCTPEMLVQFAHMGSCFAEDVLGIRDPSIGLLTIGEEPGKGNQLARDAYYLLVDTPGLRFIGNVEGRDLLADKVNVIVTDGFTGNVALKTAEGTAREMAKQIRAAAMGSPISMLGGLLMRGATRKVRTRFDPETYGGAFLLGLAGISVVGHGSSSRVAVANACRLAAEGVRHDICGHVAARLAR
jgi:glycerol-3-phosphate acyltransferase PlsX